MNTFPLYSEGEKVYPLSKTTTSTLVKELLPAVSAFVVNKDADALMASAIPATYKAFSAIRCNPDGSSAEDVTTDIFTASAAEYYDVFAKETKDEGGIVLAGMQKFGAENTYFFNYDWRLDPLCHADYLHDFICRVKSETGCTKLSVAAFSMGGTVVTSYLYKYGSKDIASLILASTAFQGTSCVGDMFSGNIEFSFGGLINRLGQLTRNNELEQIISYLNEGLRLRGITQKIENFVSDLCDKELDTVYHELIIPIFGYMPGLWALVDDINYDNAKAFMLGDNPDDMLMSRIDEYHNNVQLKSKELLEAAMPDTQVYILAQYNMQGLPVSAVSSSSNNDFLIDCAYASGGAICAPLGGTLGAGYTQKVNDGHNHISPDGQIDASTCMFPEQTWFIRDMAHVDYPVGGGSDIITYLASADTQLTVFSSDYSQFLKYDVSANTLSPVNSSENTTSISSFLAFLAKIREFFYSFRKVFNSGC